MTQLELARRALRTAQTHLRLASSLMTLDGHTRDDVRALVADAEDAGCAIDEIKTWLRERGEGSR